MRVLDVTKETVPISVELAISFIFVKEEAVTVRTVDKDAIRTVSKVAEMATVRIKIVVVRTTIVKNLANLAQDLLLDLNMQVSLDFKVLHEKIELGYEERSKVVIKEVRTIGKLLVIKEVHMVGGTLGIEALLEDSELIDNFSTLTMVDFTRGIVKADVHEINHGVAGILVHRVVFSSEHFYLVN